MDREKICEKLVDILKKYGVNKIAVFGSFARGEDTPDSVLDIIVEFSVRKSLFDIVRIERELSEELGIKVDLLTEKSISPYIADEIQKDLKVIFK